MSDTVEQSDETVADRFQHALRAGNLDTCSDFLRDGALADGVRASLYCRLGGAWFYRGLRDPAVGCARAAFELQPASEPIADFCAWL
ncbi:MAG TPA: hypothetical protein VFQ82_10195, partial [Stellaceae bacterium]|nr:hypothetical protein [Stellaceae bacterium]